MSAADIARFSGAINYEFKDRSLLREALTHRSYAAEAQLKYDNQRLEFLGDAVLEIILSEYVYRLLPDATEGAMTKLRSALAQEPALARIARMFGLGDFLLMGRGEQEAGGENRDSTLCDLFEAVLGAVYLDGGLEAAREFAIRAVTAAFPEPEKLLVMLNPKGTLQEFTQHKWGETPQYVLVDRQGPDHCREFTCKVTAGGLEALGSGGSRRLAEGEAARKLIGIIAESDPSIKDFI